MDGQILSEYTVQNENMIPPIILGALPMRTMVKPHGDEIKPRSDEIKPRSDEKLSVKKTLLELSTEA